MLEIECEKHPQKVSTFEHPIYGTCDDCDRVEEKEVEADSEEEAIELVREMGENGTPIGAVLLCGDCGREIEGEGGVINRCDRCK